ncbi:MAG: hypothetical protein CL819_15360 [Croceicoccus sp.]|nr:hypothetical protein [Croceicoccus sp.]
MILAFDVAQSCGWAAFDSGTLKAYGAIRLAKADPLINLEKLRGLFDGWATREGEANHMLTGLGGVFVEGVAFSRFRDAHASYWRVRTLIEIVAAEHGCYPVTEVNTSTLKKWATNNGRASKAEMCAAARERFSVDLYARTDDVKKGSKAQEDQADAILVGAWAND